MVKNAKRICVAICFGPSNDLTGLLNDRSFKQYTLSNQKQYDQNEN